MASSANGQPRVAISEFLGPRGDLRFLFELAEDSAAELDSYIHDGVVIIARDHAGIVGHLQYAEGPTPTEMEIKNMAVLPAYQRRGIGARLVAAALEAARAAGRSRVLVATAAADTDNLTFYQRAGFRFCSIERDVFTPERGYPDGTLSNGIVLRDRVWLDRDVALEQV
jgi:GNAT superfamily N-acetyltransferase